jgi:murein DD-endopeptidase MepM/ murein hydrolase activator NlpD
MEQNKNKNRLVKKLKHKYRIAILNEQTYEETFSMRLSRLNVFTTLGITVILLILVTTILIAFTTLREYIPGYPTGEQRRMMINNYQRVDSLLFEIERRDNFIANMRAVISGELPASAFRSSDSSKINPTASIALKAQKSAGDSMFISQIEEEERFNLNSRQESNKDTRLEMVYFFPPIKGIITNKFGDTQGHFGVDIVAAQGSRVSAIYEGTVIFTGWTVETGYVIQIQHENQLISLYKHNGKLLKKMGDRVKAGEVIAMVGNSGELTTGPHLHFEMWHAGVPINPENYISFE